MTSLENLIKNIYNELEDLNINLEKKIINYLNNDVIEKIIKKNLINYFSEKAQKELIDKVLIEQNKLINIYKEKEILINGNY